MRLLPVLSAEILDFKSVGNMKTPRFSLEVNILFGIYLDRLCTTYDVPESAASDFNH